MKVAFLGSSSQIAKDLILSFSKNEKYELFLFCRNVELLKNWAKDMDLDIGHKIKKYIDFNNNQNYDVLINFIGVGDPVKVKNTGERVVKVTEIYDYMAIEYIENNPKTKYIFLSSGSVFGSDYQKPADQNTVIKSDVDRANSKNWYALSKIQAENRHRELPNLPIVDVRVFNYFSHTQDMNARFLMTDIVRAIRSRKVFKTSPENIVRDFMTPPDFYNFIQAIINSGPINIALDCYTKRPVTKFDLLIALQNKFGLRYQVNQLVDIIDATGVKKNYYSKNKAAEGMGYRPSKSSLEAVMSECILLFNLE